MVLANVFDSVRWSDDLGRSVLSFRTPHGKVGKKTAMGDFELYEGVGDVTSTFDVSEYSHD